MKCKKTTIVGSILVAFILVVAYVSLPSSRTGLLVFASGTPDSYGNKIQEFRIQQFNGSDWNTVVALLNDTYASGVEVPLVEEMSVRFFIRVFFNKTLASSIAEAKTRIKVNMTIAGVWTNQSLVGTDYNELLYLGEEGDVWMFDSGVYTEWGGGPATGTIYAATVLYQVYA